MVKRGQVYFDREAYKFMGINDVILKKLKDTYPGLDVEHELKKMELWLMDPEGIIRKGTLQFISNWLSNASRFQKTFTKQTAPIEQEVKNTEITPAMEEYVKDLWKGKEELLNYNQLKK
jgi:hypothetical protein